MASPWGAANALCAQSHGASGLESLKIGSKPTSNTSFALSVLPSLKGLMAHCRSVVGLWSCRVYSSVFTSDAVTLFLIMPMTTPRAK